MKTKITVLLCAFALIATSCEDVLTVELDAEFLSEIDAVSMSEEVLGIATKSESLYNFSGEDVIALADDEDIEPYLDRIRSIDITGIECSISGIPVDESITSLTIEFEGTIFNQEFLDITSVNNSFIIEVSDEILDDVESYFEDNESLTIKVYGSTSTAPMYLTVSLKFITKIEAGVL